MKMNGNRVRHSRAPYGVRELKHFPLRGIVDVEIVAPQK